MANYNEKDLDEEPIVEKLDFNNPTYKFTPNETHEWRQKGFFLECQSCELLHATYIGPNKIITGIDEKGQPLFKKR